MATQNELAGVIGRLQPFKAGALTGDRDKRHRSTGRLSAEPAGLFEACEPGPHGTGAWFVVSSYSTPIAWYNEGKGWFICDKSALDGPTPTTTKHINTVMRMLNKEDRAR